MNKEKIAIITDSGTNVPPAFAKKYDIRILPLQISYQKNRTNPALISLLTK